MKNEINVLLMSGLEQFKKGAKVFFFQGDFGQTAFFTARVEVEPVDKVIEVEEKRTQE